MTTSTKKPAAPQDHKSKTEKRAESFVFEHNGVEYTLKNTQENLSTGLLRKIRKLDEINAFFEIMEALMDDEQLEILDSLSHEELGELHTKFYAYLGASQGE